jgi:hypothetical protein
MPETKTFEIEDKEIIKHFGNLFMKHLHSSNFIEKVLYGQIHIESLLVGLLENSLHSPSKLNLDKMTFFNKIKLAVALGCVDFDIQSSLEKLGNIRNNIAHDFDTTITLKEEKDFLNVLKTSHLKTKIRKEEKNWDSPFSYSIYVLWFYLMEQILKSQIKKENILLIAENNIVLNKPETFMSIKSFESSVKKIIEEKGIKVDKTGIKKFPFIVKKRAT